MNSQQIATTIEILLGVLAVLGPLFLIWLDPANVRKDLGITRTGQKL